MVARADRRGPGSILEAIVRSDTSADILDAAQDRLARRLVGPLVANMRAQGVDRRQLRADDPERQVADLEGVPLPGYKVGISAGQASECPAR
jgi:hypothetical protein